MAEGVKFVLIDEYSSVTKDLLKSSENLKSAVGEANEAATLHASKYEHVKKAEELLGAMSKDITRFMRMVPIRQPESRAARTRITVPQASKPRQTISYEDKELVARSHRALANLQKNLAELKSELGKV